MEVMALSVKLKEEGAATVESALKKLKLSTLAASVSIGATLTAAFNKLVSATSEAQSVQAQLANAIRTTGSSAGQSIEQLNAHSAALQSMTAFGDDAIGQAQARLLSYTGIVGENFPRATEVVLDYAAAFNTDLVQASEAVGKALNYPTVGLGMLSKQGFIFTEAQKEQLKYFEETNQLAKAQAIIFEELESVTKGAAAAQRDTLGGALQALNEAFGDLFEVSRGASSGIINALEGVTSMLVSLNNNMGKVIASAKVLAIVLLAPFAAKIVAAVVAFIGRMRALIAAQAQTIAMAKLEATAAINTARAMALKGASASQLAAAQLRAAIASRNLTLQTSLLSRAMVTAGTTAKAMWVAIGGPIGVIVVAVGALVMAFDHANAKMLEAEERREEAIVQSKEYQAALYLSKRRQEELNAVDENAGLTIAQLTARQADLKNQTLALTAAMNIKGVGVVRAAERDKALVAAQEALKATTEALKKAQEEAAEAERERINNMAALVRLTPITRAEYAQLQAAEAQVTARLSAGNVSLAERIELLERQKSLQAALTEAAVLKDAGAIELQGLTDRTKMFSTLAERQAAYEAEKEKAARKDAARAATQRGQEQLQFGISLDKLKPQQLPKFRELTKDEQFQAEVFQFQQEVSELLGDSISNSIQDGFASGIAAAISSGRLSDAWKAMSQAIIQNLASAMAAIAVKAINFATLLGKIQQWMILNPWKAAAVAAALLAVAYANGGKAGATGMGVTGGAGGASFSAIGTPMTQTGGEVTRLIFGQTSATTAAGMTPRQATNVTIIGPDDPKAQRAIEELIRKGQQRGTLG